MENTINEKPELENLKNALSRSIYDHMSKICLTYDIYIKDLCDLMVHFNNIEGYSKIIMNIFCRNSARELFESIGKVEKILDSLNEEDAKFIS